MNLKPLHENPEYIPELAKWFQAQWGYLHPGRQLQQVIDELSIAPGAHGLPYTYILLEGREIVGTASLIDQDMPDWLDAQDLMPWLASVYVREDKRQQGYGEQLVTAVEKLAQQLSFKQIFLFSPDKANWYQKLAWSIITQTKYHGDFVTVMRKSLV